MSPTVSTQVGYRFSKFERIAGFCHDGGKFSRICRIPYVSPHHPSVATGGLPFSSAKHADRIYSGLYIGYAIIGSGCCCRLPLAAVERFGMLCKPNQVCCAQDTAARHCCGVPSVLEYSEGRERALGAPDQHTKPWEGVRCTHASAIGLTQWPPRRPTVSERMRA